MPREIEALSATTLEQMTAPAAGDILIKQHHHAGLVTGRALRNGTFPSVEGNSWAKSDFAHRREGVYVLDKDMDKDKVEKCTFWK